MSPAALKMRYCDLAALPEDGKRHEIIDGQHYMSAAPSARHQEVLGNLFSLLRGFIKSRRLGKLFFAPLDVWLSEHDVVEPDLLFVRRERLTALEERFLRGAPDLAAEVLSPSTRQVDRGVKLRAYRRFGFGEYWIVDPVGETVEVFRGEGDWTEPAVFLSRAAGSHSSRELALTSPLFPGLVLTMDQIFE
jgi:Uma2 family endonuclease